MKFSRPAAVVASVVLLTGGTIAVVNAAGEPPVTLCANTKTSAVTVPPTSGACPKGTTAISLPSKAALDALSAQVDTATAALASQAAEVETLRSENDDQTQALADLESKWELSESKWETSVSALEDQDLLAQRELAALSDRVSKLETAGFTMSATPSSFHDYFNVRGFNVLSEGHGLKPDSPVYLHWKSEKAGYSGSMQLSKADADGIYNFAWRAPQWDGYSYQYQGFKCINYDFYLSGRDPNGFRLTSSVLEEGPGCDREPPLQISATNTPVDCYYQCGGEVEVIGRELKPGSKLTGWYKVGSASGPTSFPTNLTVAADGTIHDTISVWCGSRDWQFSAETADGGVFYSNEIADRCYTSHGY